MRFRFFAVCVTASFLASGCGGPDERVDEAQEAMKVCAKGSTLEGVDVSHYDGAIDWAKVAASGRKFAIAKATEHSTYVDATFATNWSEMKKNGVVRSAYHFFHSNEDPIAQADHFLKIMGPLEPGDLPPCLDLEVDDGQSSKVITDTAIQWLDRVAAKTGTKPLLYSSPSFISGTMGSPSGLDQHATLWIANWQVSCPDVPSPYADWAFWQNAATGSVPGIPDTPDVDHDVFNGTISDLTALTVPEPTTSSSSAGVTTGVTTGAGGASSESGTGKYTVVSSTSTGSHDPGGVAVTEEGSSKGGCACEASGAPAPSRLGWLAALSLLLVGRRRGRSDRRADGLRHPYRVDRVPEGFGVEV